MSEEDESDAIDLGEALGASDATSTQVLTVYIPNKDRDGSEFGTQRKWVLEAAHLLAEFGGGFTVMPVPDANRKVTWTKGAAYAGVYGTDFVVQTSNNLSVWDDVPQAQVTIDAGSVGYTIPGDSQQRFVRLKVTGP